MGSGEAQTFAPSYQNSICRPDFKSCNTVCSGEHSTVVVQRQESPQLKDTAKTTPSPALLQPPSTSPHPRLVAHAAAKSPSPSPGALPQRLVSANTGLTGQTQTAEMRLPIQTQPQLPSSWVSPVICYFPHTSWRIFCFALLGQEQRGSQTSQNIGGSGWPQLSGPCAMLASPPQLEVVATYRIHQQLLSALCSRQKVGNVTSS